MFTVFSPWLQAAAKSAITGADDSDNKAGIITTDIETEANKLLSARSGKLKGRVLELRFYPLATLLVVPGPRYRKAQLARLCKAQAKTILAQGGCCGPCSIMHYISTQCAGYPIVLLKLCKTPRSLDPRSPRVSS